MSERMEDRAHASSDVSPRGSDWDDDALIELEHNVNRIAGHRFRVMLWLTVAVTR